MTPAEEAGRANGNTRHDPGSETPKPRSRSGRWLIVPAALMIVGILGSAAGLLEIAGLSLTPGKLFHKLVVPVARLLVFLAIGLLAAQIIEAFGWTARLARITRPLLRFTHLGSDGSAAFTASFVSGILANSLLMNAHTSGRLGRRELFLTYLADAGLPVHLLHLPGILFVIVPLTREAGIAYLVMTLGAAFIQTTAALMLTRVLLPRPDPPGSAGAATATEPARRTFRDIVAGAGRRYRRVFMYTVPIYAIVFLLNEWGLFARLRESFASVVAVGFVPVEAAGVVIFGVVAEFTSGMAAAGALLEADILTVKQTALALIAATIIASPVSAIRHGLPALAGIYTVGLAAKLLVASQSLRTLCLIATAIPYALWG